MAFFPSLSICLPCNGNWYERLLKIVNSFAESPERSINQACEDWHQSKAAYRFFQNDAISERKILDSHIIKTVERVKNYLSYPRHELYFI